MTDDSHQNRPDVSDGASTNPLPAVGEDDRKTQPLDAIEADGPDPPTTPHQSALTAPDEYTEMIPADLAMPGDATGAVPSSSVFDDVPTMELPDDQTLVPHDVPTQPSEDDVTNPGAVSDDAIVRRVKLPAQALPTSPLPSLEPQPTQLPDRDETQFAVLPVKPRQPLPNEQLPPARGPVPLAQFQVRPNVQDTRSAEVRSSAPNPWVLWAVAVGTAAAWGVIANLVAASQWMAPSKIFLLSLGAIVPIALVTVAVGRPRHRPLEPRDALDVARPVAAALILLLVASLPWQVGLVRGALRGLAGGSPEAIRSVLNDRSGSVALEECARVAPNFARPGVAEMLAETLAERPQVLEECLARVPDVAGLLSGTLVQKWYGTMVAADTPPARACTLADSVSQLERPPGEVETRLLGCIMFASAGAQECCASALAESSEGALDWVGRVQNQRGYVPDAETAKGLLALTFGSSKITPEQEQFVKDADFRGPGAQRMAVVLGCAALKENVALGAQFLASVPKTCALDRGSYPTDSDTWLEVCDASMDRLVRRRRDPGETLCIAASSVVADEAIAAAAKGLRDARKRALVASR